jgi:hypothetical protein
MQIQLNGSTQLAELQNQHTPKLQLKLLQRWMTLYHQIAMVFPVPEAEDLPELIGQLVQLFLGNPAHLGDEIYQLLYRLLLDIDREQGKMTTKIPMAPKSIVQQLIENICMYFLANGINFDDKITAHCNCSEWPGRRPFGEDQHPTVRAALHLMHSTAECQVVVCQKLAHFEKAT